MRSVKTMIKEALEVLVVLVLLLWVAILVNDASAYPEVFMNAGTGKMVGCHLPDVGFLDGRTMECKQAQQGKYSLTWVSSQWKLPENK